MNWIDTKQADPDPGPGLDADAELARRVDSVERRVIQEGAPMVGSAIGLGSILGSVTGPEGTAIGAVVGLFVGFLFPLLARRSH